MLFLVPKQGFSGGDSVGEGVGYGNGSQSTAPGVSQICKGLLKSFPSGQYSKSAQES